MFSERLALVWSVGIWELESPSVTSGKGKEAALLRNLFLTFIFGLYLTVKHGSPQGRWRLIVRH